MVVVMPRQFRHLSSTQLEQLFDELLLVGNKRGQTSEVQRLLHELHVHQVELEMQNRELLEAQARLEESRDRYADLYDFAPVGYLTLDPKGLILELNLTAATLLNASRSELEGRPLVSKLAVGQSRYFQDHLQSVICASGKDKSVTELTLNDRQGPLTTVRLESVAHFDTKTKAMVVRAAMIDITEQNRAEADLQQAHDELELKVSKRTAELLAANQSLEEEISARRQLDESLRQAAKVFDSTQEGIVITDPHYNILAVNRAFSQITGYTEQEVKDQHLQLLQSVPQEEDVERELWISLAQGGRWQGELRKRRKSGELFAALESITAVRDRDGEVTNYVAVFADISNIKASQERLNFLAYHDPLTSLPNRLLFNAKLEHALQRAERHRHKFALLFLDLDRFKTINDTLGHKYGDTLLQAIARALTSSVRKEDTVARLGGDEFVILLDEVAHAEDAAGLAEKVIAKVAQPISVGGHELVTSTSIGISVYPDDADNLDDLIKAADTAMYHAKASGKQTYRFYTAELTDRAFEHLSIEHGLRQALVNGEFVLYYQPMVSLASGDIIGVEALLRWRHPEKGLLLPEAFISVAEETGLICEIGEWVLQEACRQTKAWRAAGLPALQIAINVSVRQILYDDLAGKVRAACQAAGLAPNELELEMEITESVLQGAAESTEALEALHDIGIKLSVDDFGTGYSSLSKLKHFPIDTIKIDRSFVHDIPGNTEGEAIVTAIIALARSMKLEVVAEGVESTAQREFLQSQGCNDAQGYLFEQPLTAAEIGQFFGQGES
jgi:diguanylate cyclase (GGDEF)-like protein/PAS domain S-box-containing protein